jgi:hypothetical protein
MTQRKNKRPGNAKRGRPFAPGNQAAKGKGRPKKDFDLETRTRELSPEIIERYAIMGRRAKTTAEVTAGRVVLAYAWGNPRARVEHSGPGGGPIPMSSMDKMTSEDIRRELAALEGDEQSDDEPGDPEPPADAP